ncbi:hypothetical protein BSL78_17566 [Apostichopus japonicus]|uniref:Uncharacterized protein n=1 Tax=Stichopus japonicus TaxID=307972 RepID=A0A2G8KC53_STIJA|nr:hypothetical protein BSL78_17566 [Apostichopus japonicus]
MLCRDSAPSVNDEQAKEALLQFVSEKCCYGTGAARNMKINDIVQSSAFHYKLETFTEKRLTKHAFEPYRVRQCVGVFNIGVESRYGQCVDVFDIGVESRHGQSGSVQEACREVNSTYIVHECHVMTAMVQGSVDVMFALEEDGPDVTFVMEQGGCRTSATTIIYTTIITTGDMEVIMEVIIIIIMVQPIDHAPPVWDSDATGIKAWFNVIVLTQWSCS